MCSATTVCLVCLPLRGGERERWILESAVAYGDATKYICSGILYDSLSVYWISHLFFVLYCFVLRLYVLANLN